MKISIIAAIGPNRELGRANKLLWQIPKDMKRFRQLTQGHAVIMGQKTYESIGKPLPNRLNIVLTRDPAFKAENCLVYFSIEEAMNALKSLKATGGVVDENRGLVSPAEGQKRLSEGLKALINKINFDEIFICGGGQIYTQFLPLADKLYLTLVEGKYEADTFFPDYSSIFKKVTFSQKGESAGYKYKFIELEKA
jgi:dihydrofolate reductase